MKNNNQLFKYSKLFSCMVLGGGFLVGNTSLAAEDAVEDTEVIQVSGFRSSLNASLMTKRDAAGSKDVILAEDIGKFPDLNVADSLSRVPGISVEEDGGEGRQITIRGLGSRFVKTTINGMESASAGAGTDAGGGSNTSRAFDFNTFASELFTMVEVDKSTSAALEDGGIGGNVNLQSARPFQYEGTKLAYNVNARYNDIAGDVTPRLSFMASHNWDNEFGILASVAYNEGVVQSEGATTVRWTVLNPNFDDKPLLTKDPVTWVTPKGSYTNDQLDGLYIPRIPRYSIFESNQERLGITTALQWAPTDDLTLSLDVLHASLSTTMNEYQYSVLFRDNKQKSPLNYAEAIVKDANGMVTAGAFSDVFIRSEARQDKSESDFTQISFNADWYLTDKLKAELLVGVGQSELSVPHQRTFALDSRASAAAYSFDSSVNPLDLLNNPAALKDGGKIDQDMMSWAFLPAAGENFNGGNYTQDQLATAMTQGSDYTVGLVRNRKEGIESDNSSIKLDFSYELSDELTLKFGVNQRTFETKYMPYRNDWKKGLPGEGTGCKGEVCVVEDDTVSLAGQDYATTLSALGVDFGNAADVPANSSLTAGSWLTPDYDKMMAAFSGKSYFESRLRADKAYDIKEDVFALYTQLDFRLDWIVPVRGNIGVRYLDNENQSSTILGSSRDNTTRLPKNGEYQWGTVSSSGDDFLPSLNLAFDLTDDLVARFNAGKAITRPKISDLSSAISVSLPKKSQDNSDDTGGTIKAGGGPSIQPYESTQFDLGLEWYFTEEALLGATVFWKDITDLRKQTVNNVQVSDAELRALGVSQNDIDQLHNDFPNYGWSVDQLVNTEPTKMWGAEFVYQQPFSFLPEPFNNLGVQSNYTYIDYTFDDEDPFYGTNRELVALETSENTFNATVYYEVDNWSARVSYGFREGYNKELRNEYKDEGTYGRGYDDKSTWKFSAKYDLTDNMAVSFEAINLSNEPKKQWQNFDNHQPVEYLVHGRQFLVGLRGSL
ncbi:TonB-dependent receptor (plasmid) [Saccharobesus litoralis]|uniref:TonB-dependent receptor n=1 Tax=Saccharobesus litoralis TaxID=2172099 RepID=A0A2S0VYC5_9ALTE|nr:TonB-dependent receptor [Saccharobesus litoralis]AWB69226.1 TonB-dependent receptor [Saccharobesus litoralis]